MAQTYANQNTDYSRDLGAEDNQVEKPRMVHDQRATIAQGERNQKRLCKTLTLFHHSPAPHPKRKLGIQVSVKEGRNK